MLTVFRGGIAITVGVLSVRRTVLFREGLVHTGDLGAQLGVFDPELVHNRATLFPAPIGLIRGREGGVEELGARLEVLDVPGAGSASGPCAMLYVWHVLISALAEGALGLSILFRALALAEGTPTLGGRLW